MATPMQPPRYAYGDSGHVFAGPPTLPPQNVSALQRLIGRNSLPLAFLPYFIATALQDTHLRLGLIIAAAVAGFNVVLGAVAFLGHARKVYPYVLEVFMLLIMAVQLGVAYKDDDHHNAILRLYNFITLSVLAGVTLISMLVKYPVGLPAVQEHVHWAYHRHDEVYDAAYVISGVLLLTFIACDLLYIIPISQLLEDEHFNALNLIFRIIVPMVLPALALAFARWYPYFALENLVNIEPMELTDKELQYVAYPPVLKSPNIIDNALYGSDAVYNDPYQSRGLRASPQAQHNQYLSASPASTPKYGSAYGSPQPYGTALLQYGSGTGSGKAPSAPFGLAAPPGALGDSAASYGPQYDTAYGAAGRPVTPASGNGLGLQPNHIYRFVADGRSAGGAYPSNPNNHLSLQQQGGGAYPASPLNPHTSSLPLPQQQQQHQQQQLYHQQQQQTPPLQHTTMTSYPSSGYKQLQPVAPAYGLGADTDPVNFLDNSGQRRPPSPGYPNAAAHYPSNPKNTSLSGSSSAASRFEASIPSHPAGFGSVQDASSFLHRSSNGLNASSNGMGANGQNGGTNRWTSSTPGLLPRPGPLHLPQPAQQLQRQQEQGYGLKAEVGGGSSGGGAAFRSGAAAAAAGMQGYARAPSQPQLSGGGGGGFVDLNRDGVDDRLQPRWVPAALKPELGASLFRRGEAA